MLKNVNKIKPKTKKWPIGEVGLAHEDLSLQHICSSSDQFLCLSNIIADISKPLEKVNPTSELKSLFNFLCPFNFSQLSLSGQRCNKRCAPD